jgi:hypothetical protein
LRELKAELDLISKMMAVFMEAAPRSPFGR